MSEVLSDNDEIQIIPASREYWTAYQTGWMLDHLRRGFSIRWMPQDKRYPWPTPDGYTI